MRGAQKRHFNDSARLAGSLPRELTLSVAYMRGLALASGQTGWTGFSGIAKFLEEGLDGFDSGLSGGRIAGPIEKKKGSYDR